MRPQGVKRGWWPEDWFKGSRSREKRTEQRQTVRDYGAPGTCCRGCKEHPVCCGGRRG